MQISYEMVSNAHVRELTVSRRLSRHSFAHLRHGLGNFFLSSSFVICVNLLHP